MEAYTFELNNIINKGMIPVVRKLDIIRARALSREEKKEISRGGPDILMISPSGQQCMMHRAEVLKQYTYLDGKKISMAGWSSSKEYIIAKMDNTDAVAMMVPLNCSAEVNGVSANSTKRTVGDYIVGLVDKTGNIDQSTIGIIPAAVFKKMYYMPPNEVISRNRNSGCKNYTPGMNKNNNKSRMHTKKIDITKDKPIDFTGQLGINTESFDFGEDDIYNHPESKPMKSHINMAKKEPEKVVQADTSTNYKYIATGKFVGSNGDIVGFVIQNKAGQTKNVTKRQMMELCHKKLVSNIMVGVKSDTGTAYLRGNNIRIDMLPSYKSPY